MTMVSKGEYNIYQSIQQKSFRSALFHFVKKEYGFTIWPETVEAINNYIKHREPDDLDEEHLFLNAHGKSITRFGIRRIIKKYTGKASQECSSLNDKQVGPHTFRLSTAMYLIQSGNDINMIKLWLGYVDINTTPGRNPSLSLMSWGIVTWPLLVIFGMVFSFENRYYIIKIVTIAEMSTGKQAYSRTKIVPMLPKDEEKEA